MNKIINIVPKTGNCVAASMPLALATAINDGRIQRETSYTLLAQEQVYQWLALY